MAYRPQLPPPEQARLPGRGLRGHRRLQFTAEVGIPGRFNAYNALAAMGACQVLGIPVEAMKQGLSTVKVKGRVEPVPVPGNYTLLLDYAHNGVGMENILTTCGSTTKRLICMFGAGATGQGAPV